MHVVLNLASGGTERLVVELAKRMAASIEAVVCCLEGTGPLAAELNEARVPVIGLHRRPGFHPSLGLRIAQAADAYGATVLHCHQYTPFVYGQIARSVRRGLGLVFTEHGRATDGPPSRKRQLVNPVLARLPGQLFAVSEALRADMAAEGWPAHRVGVIHNGIDVGPRVTDADRAAARGSLGLPADAIVFGTAARLDPVKNLDAALEAFRTVQAHAPRSRLVIVGDGPDRARLEQLACESGVTGAVMFTGYRPDVRRLLAGFDAYVNSSVYEGISLTLLEAMAASLPAVATAVGGTPEVVTGDTGLLVPPRAPQRLAEAMLALAGSAERRVALGVRARGRVEAMFSVERMVSRYLGTYGIAPPPPPVVAAVEDFGPRKPAISGAGAPVRPADTPPVGAGAGHGFAEVVSIRE
jgi:glycosyltransferase involved in cell wall biosynthesis